MITDQKNISRTIRSILLLFLGTISGAGLSFVSQILFARTLSPSEYGLLASYLVTINMLIPVAGFGVGPFWLRVFGIEGFSAQRWVRPSFRLLGTSSLFACLLYVLWSWFSSGGENSNQIIWFFIPLIFSYALVELVTARLQLEERYSYLAIWQSVPHINRFLVALALIIFGGTLKHVGIGFFCTAMTINVVGFFLIKTILKGKIRLIGHLKSNPKSNYSDPPGMLQVAQNAWPFALAGFFYLIYFQSDILLLRWLINSKAAGVYNVAYVVMVAVYLIPSVIFQKFLLPKQHRWAEHDRSKFLEVFRFGCGSMLVLGVLVMILVQIIAPWGIPFLFGNAYTTSAKLLFILSFCIPIKFLATSVGGTLVTQNHMRRKVWYMGTTAVLNIILNIVLIPKWTYYGAAIATFISELNLLIIYLIAVRRNVFGPDAWRGWKIYYKSK